MSIITRQDAPDHEQHETIHAQDDAPRRGTSLWQKIKIFAIGAFILVALVGGWATFMAMSKTIYIPNPSDTAITVQLNDTSHTIEPYDYVEVELANGTHSYSVDGGEAQTFEKAFGDYQMTLNVLNHTFYIEHIMYASTMMSEEEYMQHVPHFPYTLSGVTYQVPYEPISDQIIPWSAWDYYLGQTSDEEVSIRNNKDFVIKKQLWDADSVRTFVELYYTESETDMSTENTVE